VGRRKSLSACLVNAARQVPNGPDPQPPLPALAVIEAWDDPETLSDCDPPYLPETREGGSRDVYGVEMTEANHIALAEALNRRRGRVVLSGDPSPLYAKLYRGWRVETFDMPNHAAAGRTKGRKAETIWIKSPPDPRPTAACECPRPRGGSRPPIP
jgi:hypothetical protein